MIELHYPGQGNRDAVRRYNDMGTLRGRLGKYSAASFQITTKPREIQVAHTERKDKKLEPLTTGSGKVEPLPVIRRASGSARDHTHTEWLIQYTDENYKFFAKVGYLAP